MQNLTEIYSTIVELPVEYQVILGIGALVVLAALRNMWGILFPLRWTVAFLLRTVAYVLHPRGRRRRSAPNLDVTKNSDSLMGGVGTQEGFIKAAKYYSKSKRVKNLDDKQLDLLLSLGEAYHEHIKTDYSAAPTYVQNLRYESRRRVDRERTNEKLEKIFNPPKSNMSEYMPPALGNPQVADEFTRRETALKLMQEAVNAAPEPEPEPRTKISMEQVL